MIGRDRELAQLQHLLTAVGDGDGAGRVVLVEGEAGIGKTTLLAAAAQRARAAGFHVLRCEGTEGGAAAGFTALHELLHPVLDRAQALPDRQRRALLTAFGLDDGPPPDRLLIRLAVLGLLEEVASTRPLLLLVEDVQWLDTSTGEVIAFLARRLSTTRLLLLAAVRTGSTAEAPWVPTLRAAAELVHLQPLDDGEARQLLRSLEDRSPEDCSLDGGAPGSGTLSEQARQRVLREARGNPLALREFTAALAGGAGEVALSSAPLPTTRRLEAAFLDAVDRLPASGQRMLQLAAAGEDLQLAELLSAADSLGLPRHQLDPAERAGLLTVVDERVRFRHPLLRSAVHGASSSADRLAAHRALASAVRDPARAAWHRAAATLGHDEAVAAEIERAGTRAAERGARVEAAAALRRAAELTPDTSRRAARLIAAAQYARQAGAAVQAGAALQAAAGLVDAPQERYQIAHLRSMLSIATGDASVRTGDYLQEVVLLEGQLAGPSGSAEPEQRIRLLTSAAFHVVNQVSTPGERRAVHDRLAAVDAGFPHPVQQIALAVIDPLAHPQVRAQLPQLLVTFAESPQMLLALGQAAERLQELTSARTAWLRAAEAFHRQGSAGDECQALNALASVRVVLGQLSEGLADAETAYRSGLALGLPMVAAGAAAAACRALALSGRVDDAREALARAREAGVGDAVPQVPAGVSWAAGLIALQEHRYGDALADLLEVAAFPLFAAWAVADLAEAAAGAGDPAKARPLLERVDAAAVLLGSDHLASLAHRSRALLAGAQAGEEHFLAALEVGARAGSPLELARTQLLHGQWLRRTRRPVDARTSLAAALNGFERVGARALADLAAQELRAAGGTGRAGTAPTGLSSPLTAQELQVARLAAAGMSNKEIADQLYLSHRTVGAHLYRAFPKLGITSRARLHGALEAAGLLG
ncbi:ATP-binding protein [Kineococcus sp. SYSU DK005]|uniref:ATP-binding protein n=1 Tax=Kineococcus sp. SYSU DK005 TaxID=3383126 RepID=UPI003D7C49CE